MGSTSPALVLSFDPTTTVADRDRLVALLADFRLLAIQEDDAARPGQWSAFFEDVASRDAAAAAIRDSAQYAALHLESAEVEDGDWARRTQASLPAIRVGRVIVAPPWDVPATDDPLVIIEPSRGFGTGHHQSTRLCLALLQNRDLKGRTMIDVGTGSGVLAITAARLGAAYVSAVDIDPDAVENARENVVRNGVAASVDVHLGDLSRLRLAAADVVTANLTASLLVHHAANLSRLLKPGGVLIAAGFTVEERERVTEGFAPGLSVIESAEEDDWWGYVMG